MTMFVELWKFLPLQSVGRNPTLVQTHTDAYVLQGLVRHVLRFGMVRKLVSAVVRLG